jgi:DNA-binding response OmpR family regulator
MQMLLVEDNESLCATIARGFRERAVDVEAVTTGGTAIQHLSRHVCDAVVLDLGLPDRDGYEVLRTARSMGVLAPVLVLSARASVTERVRALDAGADDYLVKPFEFVELVARVHALVRRAAAPRWAPQCFGDLRVPIEKTEAHVGERTVALSPREHALLQYLVRQRGEVASRSMILSHVFGHSFDPGTNIIDVHVAHLRRKLRGTDIHVETVRGLGFRLTLNRAQPGSSTDG